MPGDDLNMIWHRGQNLAAPLVDAKGTSWNFLVGSDHIHGILTQRIFFWDETRGVTGLLELRGDACLHFRRIRDRIKRLANDPGYRERFLRPLEFPVERYW
jgi:hypothetical protein